MKEWTDSHHQRYIMPAINNPTNHAQFDPLEALFLFGGSLSKYVISDVGALVLGDSLGGASVARSVGLDVVSSIQEISGQSVQWTGKQLEPLSHSVPMGHGRLSRHCSRASMNVSAQKNR